MIRLRQLKLKVENDSTSNLKEIIKSKLKINIEEILDIKIIKKSIDARDKNAIYYVYEVDVKVNNEWETISKIKSNDIIISPDETYSYIKTGVKKLDDKIVIVGSGPAGLFSAYMLASNGYKPLIIERGEKVEDRVKTVENFFKTGILNTNSNIQFGEGGAGTFSDGKLNTLVKDKCFRMKKVFEIFVECGADESILYEAHPHIGTDVLRKVVINMRNKIISMGGTFRYNTCLTDIKIDNNKISSIIVNNDEEIKCSVLVLAIGHSARDTFYMLNSHNINMCAKPFAMGIRIMHPQNFINKSQYGEKYFNMLPSASYKLTYNTSDRGIYTFCMCPGGYVVNASSEEGFLAINGMSNHDRDSGVANSAIVVSVNPSDFGSNPLDGIEFQRKIEKKAYQACNGKIPIQLLKDFYDNKVSTKLGSVKPLFKGNYAFSNINDILPNFITYSIKEAINDYDKKIKNYKLDDAIISCVESRTSSPVRMIRNDSLVSSVDGIYPIGEGAGYAGGITTSAMDGIKASEAIMDLYKCN